MKLPRPTFEIPNTLSGVDCTYDTIHTPRGKCNRPAMFPFPVLVVIVCEGSKYHNAVGGTCHLRLRTEQNSAAIPRSLANTICLWMLNAMWHVPLGSSSLAGLSSSSKTPS